MDDETLFRHLLGRTSRSEAEAVEAWSRASPDHEARLAELRRTLSLVDADEARIHARSGPTADRIIELASRREPNAPPARKPLVRYAVVGLAAAALVAVAVGVARSRRPASPPFVLVAGEYATGQGETATVQLGDGSVLRLAPSSHLRVGGASGARAVSLEGRAYFVVARMEGYPFRVQTRAGAATVLGTRFDLEANADTLSLVVLEGRVSLRTGSEEATVAAGEISEIRNGRLRSPRKAADVESRAAWIGNFLVFQGSPLTHVAREIEAHYRVQVTIADSVLAGRTVKAWLADQNLDRALDVVCTIVDAECSVQGGAVTMRRR
jgi:transmembrane sensor